MIDYSNPKQQEIVLKLITTADVLIDPYPPGVLEKIIASPERILEINPKLILLRITSFGQDSERSKTHTTNLDIAAASGIIFFQRNKLRFFKYYSL